MSEIFYAAGKEQKNGSTFAYAGEYLKGKMFFKIVAIECRICNIKTVITSKLKKKTIKLSKLQMQVSNMILLKLVAIKNGVPAKL